MKYLVALVLSVAALPCALGILCYECMPDAKQMCDAPSNVTNCTGMFDACSAVAMKISMTSPIKLSMTARVMTCAIKANCTSMVSKLCANASATLVGNLPGAKMDVCDMKCCDTDRCNTKDLVVLPTPTKPTNKDPTALAAYTGASITISVASLLAGLALSCY